MATKSNVLLFPSKYQNYFSTAFILDNYLDSDFQKFLYPLNFLDNHLFLSKYSIRDNFITSNNRNGTLCSYLSTVFIIFIYILIICLDEGIRNFSPDLLVVGIINYVFEIIGRIIYNCTNNGFSDSHVNLILSIQRLQRTVKINYKNFTFYNWMLFSIICCYYIILFIIQWYAGRGTPYILIIYIIALIDDLNSLYLIRINKLLLECTILLESKLKTVKNFDVSPINSGRLREESLDKIFKAFLEMSKATSTYNHISEIPMFYRITFMAMYTLTYAELIIMFHRKPGNMFWAIFILWTIKAVYQVGMTCYNWEHHKLIKNIQKTIFVNMMTEDNPDINSKYESLLKESELVCEKMATSNILTVDATLPLKWLSICATYIVVLLQFAFL
nr:gustatory receptor 30.1 [Papilio memnon]